MAPDIANKLKNTLFRRRRRESSASTLDGPDSSSPPVTPGNGPSLRRPSFPFPREPSTQTPTPSLELMTGGGEVGIGGCGSAGGDEHSDAGESALTGNDAEQRSTRQHWKMWQRSKQGADADKRSSLPDSVVSNHLSPVSPVSPTSPAPVAPAEPNAARQPPDEAQGVDEGREPKDEGDGDVEDGEQHQGQHDDVDISPEAEAGGKAAAGSTSSDAADSGTLPGELQALVQASQALDQRQPQRPTTPGARVQGQSPPRSPMCQDARLEREPGQSQLDEPSRSAIPNDQGAIVGTDAASANPGARITGAAAAAGGTGTSNTAGTSTSTGGGAVAAAAAGPIPGGDLQQNQRQQQRQVQKRPRQPAPPFSLPSPPLPTPSLLTFPPLAPPTPGPSILPSISSLPSLDSIDEDESQSPSESKPQPQPQPRSSYQQSQSQPHPHLHPHPQLQHPLQHHEHQQQVPSASPAPAEHVVATAGRGIDAPPTPGAGHGPLSLTAASSALPASPAITPAEAEAGQLPTKPLPTSVPPRASSISAENPVAATSLVSTRPSAPPRRASRDPNHTVTFDETADKPLPAKNSSRDIRIATASSHATGTHVPILDTSSEGAAAAPHHPSSSFAAQSALPRYGADLEYSPSIADLAYLDAGSMVESTRKIWVTRPKASPTRVTINLNDLVDDVRDMILRKYGNTLGKTFDSPDLSLRIQAREGPEYSQRSRVLGPEEHMGNTIDEYYPGGQTVKEALVIDIPRVSTTPRPSPRAPLPHPGSASAGYYVDDGRPSENGEGYFQLVPGNASSPRLAMAVPAAPNGSVPHSMTVINSGHLPAIPSPGSARPRPHRDRDQRHDRQDYARTGRTHTPSPHYHNGGVVGSSGAVMPNSASSAVASNIHGAQHYRSRHSHSRTHSSSSEHIVPHPNSMPKSPGHEMTSAHMGTPPPQRLASPRLPSSRPKKSKRGQQQEYHHNPSPSVLTATVPPISVLIVEDNPINLKLLEAFVKRLKVRWQTAMNGSEAVKKWRSGGFHLVLMDIQLPGMNGLEATREIRRLERLNNIGVFSAAPGSIPETAPAEEELTEQDRLENIAKFKSPVIIVALTASSLQSDRHEALASGCNDFLTKPVNFVWLERKVMEWGCMQALIDFDGWRKWKDYSAKAEAIQAATKRAQQQAYKNKAKKNRSVVSPS
ncbi:Response regulator mcs4 [Trichoderma ghanense]|uniref:Response regulator mcs4 n=1 Tax=Trichoderma ghanense TaxID=65468 RepID=A0ABY2GSR8_9HYPO